MKTQKNIHEISDAINPNPLKVTDRQLFNFFSLPIWVAIAISISLGAFTQTANAENTGSDGANRGYRYIKPIVTESTAGSAGQSSTEASPAQGTNAKDPTSGDQSATESPPAKGTNAKESTSGDPSTIAQPVTKPTDGKGVYPTFAEADIDGDHYITKYELKNYPYLLQVFDKVDAGNDGKLEQHEYQNLEMETKREGEVR